MSTVVAVARPYELLGTSPAVADAVAQLSRAAADDRGVLITAEPGLDAEAIARAIHQRSGRRAHPFVALACEGASAAALDKQLLGGPQPAKAGDLETIAPASALYRAAGGTLFLSGVTEMAAPLQRRLARLLRDGEVRVLRRSIPIALDVRVIAAVEDRLDARPARRAGATPASDRGSARAASAPRGRAADRRGDARRPPRSPRLHPGRV